MPTYDYSCGKCGHSFELFQSITAKPVKQCPKCGRRSVKRLIGTGAGIIFKGSGFYETDYKRAGGSKPCAEKGGDSSSGEKAKGGAKTGSEACKDCSKSETCPSAKAAKDKG